MTHEVKLERFKVVLYCNRYNKDCSEVLKNDELKCNGVCKLCKDSEETYVNRTI